MKRHRAFTLIELLVVIGIIAILMGIVVWGMGRFGNSQREKVTRGRMETLKSMTEQLRLANNLRDLPYCDFNGNLPAAWVPKNLPTTYDNPGAMPAELEAGGPGPGVRIFGRYPVGAYRHGAQLSDSSIAVTTTWGVMKLLRSVPSNATALQNQGSDAFLKSDDPADAPHPINPQIFVDGWGNPIIFVPGAVADPTKAPWGLPVHFRDVSAVAAGKQDVKIIRSPNNQPFWASAGPDGNFDTWGDNIYSFEQ